MKCPFCLATLDRAISFRSVCSSCDKDLHCCLACKHYDLSKPYDCALYDIEPIRDKEKANFCEEFQLQETKKALPKDLPKAKSFDALFED